NTELVHEHRGTRLEYRLDGRRGAVDEAVIGDPNVGHQHERGQGRDVGRNVGYRQRATRPPQVRVGVQSRGPCGGLVGVRLEEGDELGRVAATDVLRSTVEAGGRRAHGARSRGG